MVFERSCRVECIRCNYDLQTYMINAGSHLLLTQNPDSHLSFFLEGKVVVVNFDPACVGLISHHGASVNTNKNSYQNCVAPYLIM